MQHSAAKKFCAEMCLCWCDNSYQSEWNPKWVWCIFSLIFFPYFGRTALSSVAMCFFLFKCPLPFTWKRMEYSRVIYLNAGKLKHRFNVIHFEVGTCCLTISKPRQVLTDYYVWRSTQCWYDTCGLWPHHLVELKSGVHIVKSVLESVFILRSTIHIKTANNSILFKKIMWEMTSIMFVEWKSTNETGIWNGL